jgi:hypothetical protein
LTVRKPGKIEIALQLLLVFVLLVLVIEYFEAARANACFPAPSEQGCYPWGAEGPVASDWRYENKEVYLKSLVVLIGATATAVIAPFLAFGVLSGVTSGLLVLALGVFISPWLVALL